MENVPFAYWVQMLGLNYFYYANSLHLGRRFHFYLVSIIYENQKHMLIDHWTAPPPTF